MHFAPPQRLVGEVARVNILNANENRFARGKERPGVLIAEECGHWWVLGLTTQGRYKTGNAEGCERVAVRHAERYGLSSPSYFFSSRLVRVSKIDIVGHYGFADDELVDDSIEFAGLYGCWESGLRSAVQIGGAA